MRWPSSRSAQQLDNRILGFHIHAGERLIQQQHRALLRQRARQKYALLLAAGQLADLPAAQLAQADALQRLVDPQPVLT